MSKTNDIDTLLELRRAIYERARIQHIETAQPSEALTEQQLMQGVDAVLREVRADMWRKQIREEAERAAGLRK